MEYIRGLKEHMRRIEKLQFVIALKAMGVLLERVWGELL